MGQKSIERLWRGARKIYHILLQKEATFTEIKRETGFSNTILSRYLRDLKDNDFVYLRPADRRYVAYREPYRALYDQMIHSSLLYHEVESLKTRFNFSKSAEENRRFQEKAIKAYTMLISASIPAIIRISVGSKQNAHQRLDDLIELFTRPWIHALLDLCLVKKDLTGTIVEDISKSMYKTGMQDYESFHADLKKSSTKATQTPIPYHPSTIL
jgi:hypothetical protein